MAKNIDYVKVHVTTLVFLLESKEYVYALLWLANAPLIIFTWSDLIHNFLTMWLQQCVFFNYIVFTLSFFFVFVFLLCLFIVKTIKLELCLINEFLRESPLDCSGNTFPKLKNCFKQLLIMFVHPRVSEGNFSSQYIPLHLQIMMNNFILIYGAFILTQRHLCEVSKFSNFFSNFLGKERNLG